MHVARTRDGVYATMIGSFLFPAQSDRNLSLLPNWAFSLALAEHEGHEGSSKADNLLQDALIMFPSVKSAVNVVNQ